jgi:hypothetical protein
MTTEAELKALKSRHSAEFWRNPAVTGIDIGVDDRGNPVFTIHLKSNDPSVKENLPGEIEGYPVVYLYNPIEKQ